MEPWCREIRRPGGVYRVEVVESGICVGIGIQPGTVATRLRAGYSRDDSGQRDQSKTKEEGEPHHESRGRDVSNAGNCARILESDVHDVRMI